MDRQMKSTIPNELFEQIFKYLGCGDSQQIRLVCKRWHSIMYSEYFQKAKLVINPYNIANLYEILQNNSEFSQIFKYNSVEIRNLNTSNEVEFILKSISTTTHKLFLHQTSILPILNDCLPNLEELTLSKFNRIENLDTFNLSQFRNLKSLDISNLHVISDIEKSMTWILTQTEALKLEKLCIRLDDGVMDIIINALKFHSKTLKYLHITFFLPKASPGWIQTFEMLEHLEVLKLTGEFVDTWLSSIINALPKTAPLRHFYLRNALPIDLAELVVNKWHTSLKSVECELLDGDIEHLVAWRHIIRNLSLKKGDTMSVKQVLRYMLSGGINPIDPLVHNDPGAASYHNPNTLKFCQFAKYLPNLTSISFENCSVFVDNSVLSCIFQHQFHLRHLNLSECGQITDKGLLEPVPITNLKGLQSLNLSGCYRITDLSLMQCFRFNELHTLKFWSCFNISSMGIKKLTENCPALENLFLRRCSLIDDDCILHISQYLPRLRILNIDDCQSLTDKSVDYVLQFFKSLKLLSARNLKPFNNTRNLEKLSKKPCEILYGDL